MTRREQRRVIHAFAMIAQGRRLITDGEKALRAILVPVVHGPKVCTVCQVSFTPTGRGQERCPEHKSTANGTRKAIAEAQVAMQEAG